LPREILERIALGVSLVGLFSAIYLVSLLSIRNEIKKGRENDADRGHRRVRDADCRSRRPNLGAAFFVPSDCDLPSYEKEHKIAEHDFWNKSLALTKRSAFIGIVGIILAFLAFLISLGALEESKQSFASDRAYIFSDKINVSRPIGPNSRVEISFKNFGRTPAVLQDAPAECKFHERLPPALVTSEITEFSGAFIVGAGEHALTLGRDIKASREEFSEIVRSRGNITCVFNIVYEDVRGKTHTAGICLRFFQMVDTSGFIICPEQQYRYDASHDGDADLLH